MMATAGAGPAAIPDHELFAAVLAVTDPVVQNARRHGPMPSIRSPQWLRSPLVVRRATLLVAGQQRVFEELDAIEQVDRWLGLDYFGGQFHRANHLPVIAELNRRRWPPTGDRELWIQYGPAGPPREAAA